jgi:hypothetical protein
MRVSTHSLQNADNQHQHEFHTLDGAIALTMHALGDDSTPHLLLARGALDDALYQTSVSPFLDTSHQQRFYLVPLNFIFQLCLFPRSRTRRSRFGFGGLSLEFLLCLEPGFLSFAHIGRFLRLLLFPFLPLATILAKKSEAGHGFNGEPYLRAPRRLSIRSFLGFDAFLFRISELLLVCPRHLLQGSQLLLQISLTNDVISDRTEKDKQNSPFVKGDSSPQLTTSQSTWPASQKPSSSSCVPPQ